MMRDPVLDNRSDVCVHIREDVTCESSLKQKRLHCCRLAGLQMYLLGIGIGLISVFACAGCGNLGAVFRLIVERAFATPGAPDQLLYRSGMVEPFVLADKIWMDVCDYNGIMAVEVYQHGDLIGECELMRRHLPSHVRAPGDINYCVRVKGVNDGKFTVKLRNQKSIETEHVFKKMGTVIKPVGITRPGWPPDNACLRIGYPVAAPADSE